MYSIAGTHTRVSYFFPPGGMSSFYQNVLYWRQVYQPCRRCRVEIDRFQVLAHTPENVRRFFVEMALQAFKISYVLDFLIYYTPIAEKSLVSITIN